MRIEPLYQEFLTYLQLERSYSPHTLVAYRSDFNVFTRFLGEADGSANVEGITHSVVRQYVAWLSRRGLKPSSVARRINSLRSFWNFLRDNDRVTVDPFRRVSLPKRGTSLCVHLSAEECRALLAASEQQPSAFLAFRDKAILTLMLFTGIRRSEVLNLQVSALDLTQKTVQIIHAKGHKSRLIPLADDAVLALRDWLELRPANCLHDFVFTTQWGARLGRRGLTTCLRRALARARIRRPGITPHKLRHSFACLMLQNGCDLFSLQQMLGHTRLDTTAVYLHATIDGLRTALLKHPLAGAGR